MLSDKSESDSRLLQQYIHTRASITSRGMPARNVGLSLAGEISLSSVKYWNRSVSSAMVGCNTLMKHIYVREDGELGYRLKKLEFIFVYTQEICCEHHHFYRQEDLVRRSYHAGYKSTEIVY
jgi:hypothetical protein